MQSNVVDFLAYKKKVDPTIIYIGDWVEWKDWNGTVVNRVVGIDYKPLEIFQFEPAVECFPLWEAADYVVHLENGLTVIAEAISKKMIKPDSKHLAKAGSK